MLNKDQMELIREEEVFREEVRKDIEKKRSSVSRRGKLWSFLNSSFGIWLLSSVVLGSLGFLYGYIQDTWRVKRDAQERVSRLRFEIPTHGLDFLHSLDSAHDYTDYSNLFVAQIQPIHRLIINQNSGSTAKSLRVVQLRHHGEKARHFEDRFGKPVIAPCALARC
jgi:hypothetical protein